MDEDERLEVELTKLSAEEQKKHKKQKRKELLKKAKSRMRLSMNMDAGQDLAHDAEMGTLFSITQVKGKEGMKNIVDDAELVLDSDSEGEKAVNQGEGKSDEEYDSDSSVDGHLRRLEETLNEE